MLCLLEIWNRQSAKCRQYSADRSSLQLSEQTMTVLFPLDRGGTLTVATYAADVCFLLRKMQFLFL